MHTVFWIEILTDEFVEETKANEGRVVRENYYFNYLLINIIIIIFYFFFRVVTFTPKKNFRPRKSQTLVLARGIFLLFRPHTPTWLPRCGDSTTVP